MQTNKRSIKVVVKAGAVTKLLKELGGKLNTDTEVELELEVEDNKNTYRALSSPDVIDWDFLDKDNKNIEKGNNESSNKKVQEKIGVDKIIEKKPTLENSDEAEEEGKIYFPDYTLISSIGTEGLVRVIESTWLIARETPGIRFGSYLFEEKFKSTWNYLTHTEFLKTDLNRSTTRAMMKLLVDVFYNTPTMEKELEEAYNDTVARLAKNYNSLKSVETLNQAMNILYRA